LKLSKWEQIEERLNEIIKSLVALIRSTISKLTPKAISSRLESGSKKLQKNKGNLKTKVNSFKTSTQKAIVKSKDKALEKVVIAKEKASVVAQKAKETDIKSIEWMVVITSFFALFTPFFMKLKTWYLSLKPTTIVGFITISSAFSLTSITIYQQSKKISENAREPASAELVEELEKANAISRRPAYYKKKEKQFVISNVILPVYLGSAKEKGMNKLIIDFSVESSNRYIKEYFWHNPHLLQDKLNTSIEPISIDFPLNLEGKGIIKDKLKREINVLLDELKIKGKIDEVHIHGLLGG
tara:strand:- start:14079 stop:14972 length:894 start_codon:yes stop_codon:yes gene_type:complete